MSLLLTSGTIVLTLFLLFYIYILGYKSGKKDQKKQDSKPQKDGYAVIILPSGIIKKGSQASKDEIFFVHKLLQASAFLNLKGKKCSTTENFTKEEMIFN